MTGLLVAVIAAVLSGVATGLMERLALKHRLLDVPNARSSHVTPVPRGGGVAIVLVATAAVLVAAGADPVQWLAGIAVVCASLAVAAVGFWDDRHGLSARLRFAVHAAAAIVLLGGTRGLGEMYVPGFGAWPRAQWVAAWLAIAWLINVFNFMDGIDGIAGMEGAFVSAGLAACIFLSTGVIDRGALACIAVAGASLGFLYWNWSPARIFMGDVGSGFLGCMLGALAVWSHRESQLNLWVPTILLAVFVTDATVTLVRRAARGERWYESHRQHAYQWLSRRSGSHRAVTLGVLAVNLLWLWPLAMVATLRPAAAGLAALAAYLPLVIGALLAGAGATEPRSGEPQGS